MNIQFGSIYAHHADLVKNTKAKGHVEISLYSNKGDKQPDQQFLAYNGSLSNDAIPSGVKELSGTPNKPHYRQAGALIEKFEKLPGYKSEKDKTFMTSLFSFISENTGVDLSEFQEIRVTRWKPHNKHETGDHFDWGYSAEEFKSSTS